MADDLGIMLTELPEAESVSDNDLLYLVSENNSEKVKASTLKGAVNKVQVPEVISTGDKACYVKRAIPTAGALAEGQKIVGATLAWNQLVDTGTTAVTIASGHKYIKYSGGTYTKGTSDGSAVSVSSGDLFFDITQMFGSTIADSLTVEQFSALFSDTSYAYDAGSLQSVNVSAHKAVGFNQWDEEYVIGAINDSTGEQVGGNRLCSKNYISVIPNTAYYMNIPDSLTNDIKLYYYDGLLNFISTTNWLSEGIVTIPNGVAYIKFNLGAVYGQTYNNDVCINISKTTGNPKNGDYVPYDSSSITLDNSKEFRGLYELVNGELRANGDVYEADGTVTRKYGIVDLGSLTWTKTTYNNVVFRSQQLSNIFNPSVSQLCNCISPKYLAGTANDMINTANYDKRISVYNSEIRITDSNYTSESDFKTAMNGVYLVYELATQTTETATPYTNPQIVDADGTEEFVDYKVSQGTRDVAIPVGHESDFYDYTDGAITIPDLPFADGTYALSVTMNNGTPTFSWESNS